MHLEKVCDGQVVAEGIFDDHRSIHLALLGITTTRLAMARPAPARLASARPAPARPAFGGLLPVRLAPARAALARLASARLASGGLLPVRLAPARVVRARLASARSAPARLAIGNRGNVRVAKGDEDLLEHVSSVTVSDDGLDMLFFHSFTIHCFSSRFLLGVGCVGPCKNRASINIMIAGTTRAVIASTGRVAENRHG